MTIDSALFLTPSVDKMTRPAARRHQHHIESRRERQEIGTAAEKMRQGADDALPLPRRDRFAGAGEIGARFHLDRGKNIAAPGDEIDLADWGFVAPRQD